MTSSRPLRRLAALGLWGFAAACLGACGAGGGGGGGGEQRVAPLAIVTKSLPTAGLATPYATSVQAAGGEGGYVWSVASGVLPAGVAFTTAGTFTGTPTTVGTFPLTLEVRDRAEPPGVDRASLSLTVSSFAVEVSLLRFGEAWSGESYPVAAVGAAGSPTTFTFVSNQSGGAIVSVNAAAGTAVYVPGPSPGTDRIRASTAAGASDDVDVLATDSPVASMTARFGTTDVWFVRFEGRRDTGHPYASDFDASLVEVGLRSPASSDEEGSEADQLARAFVRREVLKHLSQHYGNAASGAPLAEGFDISFPFDEPGLGYACPSPGRIEDPDPDQYNVISVLAGFDEGVIGTAFLDPGNDSQENDTSTDSAGDLGVFCNEIAVYFNSSYSNSTLRASPVGPSDVPALRALLHDRPSPGGRYAELQRIGVGFARTLAVTTAHEIGHSLGLPHTSPATTGSIMNPSTVIGPGTTYSFTAADRTTLESVLPGPGRGTGASSVAASRAASVVEAVVCGCCSHDD